MADDVDVRIELSVRLADMIYPIAWENRDFTPPDAGAYLDAKLFRTSTTKLAIETGGAHRRLGFLQVSVMAPLGEGPTAADRIAKEVQSQFPEGLWLGRVKITRTPEIATGYPDAGRWRVPVSIYWQV